jgi:hypothetical protein
VIDPRQAFLDMEGALSRRTFFTRVLKGVAIGAGTLAVLDRFGPRLFGAAQDVGQQYNTGLQLVSAFGQMVIPVDKDSGWATFEPDITTYTLDVYIRQVFNLGQDLAFNGYLQAINAFQAIPPLIGYGPAFLSMDVPTRSQYLSDILIGNFENNGVQDILSFSAIFMLLGTKMVFFQNFPHHLANPTSEFQNVLGNTPNTAWDMMGFRGPVLAAEEATLRAKAANAPEIPGVDWRNPFI